jgi:quercetin dioxygenase-like cupin family protein
VKGLIGEKMTTQRNIINLTANEGRSFLVGADLVTFKVVSHQTGGKYAIFEVITPPLSGPPNLHTHPSQETFYTLEGEYEIYGMQADGPYTIKATAGAVVHIPGGVPHNYKNVGDTPGRALLIFSPAGMEQFFAELGLPVADKANPPVLDSPPDMDRFIAISHKYQVNVLA